MKKEAQFLLILLFLGISTLQGQLDKINFKNKGIASLETGYTITKVRTALNKKNTYIVATSFEGTVLGISYEGKILWKNKLSGFMNHDIWCQDINNDQVDEILVANADGTIYCLSSTGNYSGNLKRIRHLCTPFVLLKKGLKHMLLLVVLIKVSIIFLQTEK